MWLESKQSSAHMSIPILGSLMLCCTSMGVFLSTVCSRAKYMLDADQSNVTTLSLPLQGAPSVKANAESKTATCQTREHWLVTFGYPWSSVGTTSK